MKDKELTIQFNAESNYGFFYCDCMQPLANSQIEIETKQKQENPQNGSLDNGSICLSIQLFASPILQVLHSKHLLVNGSICLLVKFSLDTTAEPLSGLFSKEN